jgi:hypothetical protein
MGNSTVRTHGIVGKAWTVGNDIYNIIAIDQTEMTVDAVERSWTFYEQRDFDQFIRSLKAVITSPSAAPAQKPAAKAQASAAPRNLTPVPKAEKATALVVAEAPAQETEQPNGLILTTPNVNSSDPLAYMKGVLMETMDKLRKDKGYVAQAKGITTAAASFTNLVALEMKIRKGA